MNKNFNEDSRWFIENFSSANYSQKIGSKLCFTYQNYFFKFIEQNKENILPLEYIFYDNFKDKEEIKQYINKYYGYYDSESNNVLVSKNLKGYLDMIHYFCGDKYQQAKKHHKNFDEEKQIIKKVLEIWKNLEQQKIYNFDLKPGNIMIKKKNDGSYDIKLIDCESFVNIEELDQKIIVCTTEPLYGWDSPEFINKGKNFQTYYKFVKLKFVLESFYFITNNNNNLEQLVQNIINLSNNKIGTFTKMSNMLGSFHNFFYDKNYKFKKKRSHCKRNLASFKF